MTDGALPDDFHRIYFRCALELARRQGAELALRGLHTVPGNVLSGEQLHGVACVHAGRIDDLSEHERGAVAAQYMVGHNRVLDWWSHPGQLPEEVPY